MSNYKPNIQERAEMFKALGNPHRLAIFHRLITCRLPDTLCDVDFVERFTVGRLGDGLDIAPSTLSHHLKELNRSGLIEMRRNGKTVECWIEADVLDNLGSFFAVPRDELNRNTR